MARKSGANQGQTTFFDIMINHQQTLSHPAGSLDIDHELREAVSIDLKHCPLSRWHVAGSMSELTGTEITKSMLDAFTAESKEGHRFPAVFIPAFCIVTRSTEVFKVLTRHVGVFVLPGEEALRSEVQRLDEEITRLKGEKQKRCLFLKEYETQSQGGE